MTFGKPRYEETNALLNRRFSEFGTLVMAHRGTASGSIALNTSAAVLAAIRSGADAVEIDVTVSSDGVAYVHHDGFEAQHLTTSVNLRQQPAAAIDEHSFRWLDRGDRTVRLERLTPMLARFRSTSPGAVIINVDRSWWWWPEVLDELGALDMTPQLLLKCHAGDDASLDALAAHAVKFPFMPICTTVDEAVRLVDRDDLNLVGLELVAREEGHPFTDPDVIADLRGRGVFAMVNAEVLQLEEQCFPGLCDERAILEGSEAGWGRLFDLGFDMIQTDWPWLLADYREYRRASRGHRAH